MRDIKSVTLELIETSTNHETGEIQEVKTHKESRLPNEPNYIKLYLADILYLNDMPTGLNSILLALLKRMTYQNDIVINSSVKRLIAQDVGKAFNTVHQAITQFVKGQILIRKDVGMYVFNPHLFGKGEWKDILSLRTTITYNLEGRTFQTSVKKNEEISSDSES